MTASVAVDVARVPVKSVGEMASSHLPLPGRIEHNDESLDEGGSARDRLRR